MENCVFCKIAAGHLPASRVYEDNMVLAFMDIQPANPGHVLVVPRRHFDTLADMDETTGMHLFQIAMRIEQAIRNAIGIQCEGSNLLQSNGPAAGQEVPHMHLHIIPRFSGDAVKLQFGESTRPDAASLKAIADAIEAML
jgi:histidine triad (HIT) family protein